MLKLDRRRKYYMILDCETATLPCAANYDIEMRKNIAIARKSIVAACDIMKGELLTEENLTVKRPGTGISPMRWEEIMGTRAIKNFSEEDLIEI